MEDNAPEIGGQFLDGLPGQRGHEPQIHAGPLRNGDCQGFTGGIHRGDYPVGLDGAFGEHIRLALEIAIIVHDFQSAQEEIGGIVGECQLVAPAVDKPILFREAVIAPVQFCLFILNGGIRDGFVHLEVDQLMDAGAECQHTLDTLLGSGIQIGSDHDAVFPEINLPIHKGIGEVLHIRVSREGVLNGFALAQIGQLRFLIGALNMPHRFLERAGKRDVFKGFHRVVHAVGGAFGAVSAHDHFRVVEEIAVDGVAILRLPQMYPVRFNLNGAAPLLQEDNVRHHFRSGVGFESGVGKPDGTQQIGSLGKIPAHGGILGIHGIAAGDEGHHTAGAHLIQPFGKEVVVDVEAQLVIGRVIDLVLTEGNISHGKVEEIPAVCGFKARNGDIRLGI